MYQSYSLLMDMNSSTKQAIKNRRKKEKKKKGYEFFNYDTVTTCISTNG